MKVGDRVEVTKVGYLQSRRGEIVGTADEPEPVIPGEDVIWPPGDFRVRFCDVEEGAWSQWFDVDELKAVDAVSLLGEIPEEESG